MDEHKMDRRVKKTKDVLRRTLIRLLAYKKIGEITVKEICELADVNRGTFYLHYSDVYDFYAAIQDEICTDVMQSVFKSAKGNVGDPGALFDIFYNLLLYLEANSEACVAILGPNWNDEFFDKLLEIPRESCMNSWSNRFGVKDESELETIYYYVVSGCLGLIKRWFTLGQKETPEYMASRMEKYITKGLMALQITDNRYCKTAQTL